MLDLQTAFNILLTAFGGLIGWVVHIIWQGQKDQDAAHQKLAEEVRQGQLLVAGEYIKRDEMREMFKDLSGKLDKIYERMDKKVDK